MLNLIFVFMIIASTIYSFFTGNYKTVVEGGLESAYSTIELMFTILSSMCVFNGIMNILEETQVTKKISEIIKKPLKLIFRDVKDDKVFGVMSMNIGANILGMGNAATPFGIKTMELLKGNERKATNSMCLFAIMNTASIQIIPSTILAIRMKYGSHNPYSVMVPIWICSILGLLIGIIAAKISERGS